MQATEMVGAGALVDLVSDFYGASMDARFWPTALSKLREALDATVCGLVNHDFSTGSGSIERAVGLDSDQMASYAEIYSRSNVWLQREEDFRSPGMVWTGEDLVAPADGAASDYFEHWLAPQGLAHQLFGVLERETSEVLCLFAARPANAGPFTAAEGTLLRRLLPYLERGLRTGQHLRRSQNVRQVALDALEAMPVGVIVLSLGGSVLAANKVARDVMADRDALVFGRSGLELVREGRRQRFRDLVAASIRPGERNRPTRPNAFSVARPGSLRPLSMVIWPARATGTAFSWDEPAAVVFIGDPDRSGDIDEIRLRQIYGLTGAEARVAALLARGYRLDEIAELLDVAYETTRKHLKQIFGKTGTGRQADLVRMVMTGPAGLTL